MTPFRTLLIDDERLALTRLRRLLADHPDTFEVIGEAMNGFEGAEKVHALRPEVVFLDIEMPGMNGFEMLRTLAYMPKVVFATAYDQFAIRAFEENSLDYLLKPIEPERLVLTVKRLHQLRESSASALTQDVLQQMMASLQRQTAAPSLQTVSVRIGDRILLIRAEEIAWFEAEDKYTFLHTADGKRHLTDYSLAELEQRLSAAFIRVSRSALVNRLHIKELVRGFSGKYTLVLNDAPASKIVSGQKYTDALRELMR